jgi:hypothetical protein
MKKQNTLKFAGCLIFATLTLTAGAMADDNGTQTQLSAQQMGTVQPKKGSSPFDEGTETSLSASQMDSIRVWAINSKATLTDLLDSIRTMPYRKAKFALISGIQDTVLNSAPKTTELMMRYVLNRGMAVVHSIDHVAETTQPGMLDQAGVLDQEIRVLTRSIEFALEFYQDDLKFLNGQVAGGTDSLISLPFAKFGVECSNFLMGMNDSLINAQAQYQIAMDSIGYLSVDLYRDDSRSVYAPAISKIYKFQKAHPGTPSTSADAIAGMTDIRRVYQEVVNNLKVTVVNN